MTGPQRTGSPQTPSDEAVRAELTRVLSSEVFTRSARLSAFLRFIVERTLDGQGDVLKEPVIAVELYGKGPDFNTAADPIVRVDARRLRDRLREYYATAPPEGVIISVPKGSYTPTFEARLGEKPADDRSHAVASASEPRRSRFLAPAVLLLLALALAVVYGVARRAESDRLPLRLLTVTAFPGYEGQAAISPDGESVVYGRTGADVLGPKDLWVKDVTGDAVQRLTDTPDLDEIGPRWSPDGRKVAFMALDTDGAKSHGVFIISIRDGRKTRVGDGGLPAWLPDGRALVMSVPQPRAGQALFLHQLDTGQRTQLTSPAVDFNDAYPAVSPDGRMLAFFRAFRRAPKAAVFLVPMAGGEAEQRTDWFGPGGGLTWTPDGRELVYATADESGDRIYRVPAFGREPGRIIPNLPITSNTPSASRSRSDGTFRLSFVHGQADVGLRLIDLESGRAHGTIDGVARFCDSARIDTPGRFSMDGERLAFASTRSGSPQVWAANRDGSNLRQLTTMVAASINVGSWSPEGEAVAFDAVVNGNADVYVVNREGGQPRQLTHAASSESDPEWSRDGRWIYYVSDATGRSEIWRIPAQGGQGIQITTGGGFEPRESTDGATLYYLDRGRRLEGLSAVATLKQAPAAGGAEQVVVSGVRPGTWDITDRGIVFLMTTAGRPSDGDALAFYEFDNRRVTRLGALPFNLTRFRVPRLAASRDSRWVVVNQIDAWERDVMVADHFR